MPQLDPAWFASQLFWLFVSFVLLYAMLSRLVLPPLLEVITRRRNTVSSDIENAQSMKTQAEQARIDYESTLAEARSRAQQLINDAMLAQKEAAEKADRETDREVAAKLSEAAKMISSRKQELVDALTPTASELASMIVEKLTRRTPAREQINELINGLLKSRSNQG